MTSRWRLVVVMTALGLWNSGYAFSFQGPQKQEVSIENDALRVNVDGQTGAITVQDKQGGRRWKQPARKGPPPTQPRFQNLRSNAAERQISFDASFGPAAKAQTLTVTLALGASGSDMTITADMPSRDREAPGLWFLEPLVLDAPHGVLVVADYSNGHLYPLDARPIPAAWFNTSRMDMPWLGLCDMDKGDGYMILVETSDDGAIQMRDVTIEDRHTAAPWVLWNPCKKTFGYARRLLYHFSPRGGYVAMAKRYRAYAKEHGLVVPFAEKLKKNPNLTRLFGAPDVWGNGTLAFAREAKAAGVEKMLIHTGASGKEIKAINELGYLTSNYDNYTDVLPIEPGKSADSSHDRIPENVVLKADDKRMTAWLTWDKKQQYMKRCPACWLPAAQAVIPKLLEKQPYVGRFIDVTTAEDLYECYDPQHPLTRMQKRECGVSLLGFVRSQGLVVGGEHGIWWSVPQLDYIEGMMSGGHYSWPAGHLLRPKSKEESFEGPSGHKYAKWDNYAAWGIGHTGRAPLWELVFHDCVVSTWYWGDASDFLLKAAPEVTPKKDLFNILYGTIPLLWANKEGSWPAAKDVFLRTYRVTCKLHEVLAGAEMLTHEFVTPDRAVQRTRFSDGTEVVVNFGEATFEVELGGRKHRLPQDGFAVHGPKIEQSRELVDGKPVTTVRAGSYSWTDAK